MINLNFSGPRSSTPPGPLVTKEHLAAQASVIDLFRFFEQVAFSIMVRNGDGHLKNYGVLYRRIGEVRLSPLYDVVTTAIYRYTQYDGGPELEDRTLALRLFRKSHSKAYPLLEEIRHFGRAICGVAEPEAVLGVLPQP